jgi:hypothetical protein
MPSKVVQDILNQRADWRRRQQEPRVIEGIACSYGADPHWDVATGDERGGTPVHAALKRLDGKRVRVTIVVLPEGDADVRT